jgi:hypothetical protein
MMADGADEELLARNMDNVHGAEAAAIARKNARAAALAGQPAQAKAWIKVLGIIQRHRTDKAVPPRGRANPLSSLESPNSTKG